MLRDSTVIHQFGYISLQHVLLRIDLQLMCCDVNESNINGVSVCNTPKVHNALVHGGKNTVAKNKWHIN